jgi:thiol-disulfide isomerase/thioredoxin
MRMTDLLETPTLSPGHLAEVFEGGKTLADFRAALPPDSPAIGELAIPPTLAGAELAFRDLAGLRVLAIVEDWCKDSRDALPVIDALMAAAPDSVLRVVRRDDHPDVMAAYLKDGRFAAIPVFVFLDRDFKELGRYVERPRSVTRLRRAEREALARRDPRFAPADAKPSAFEEPVRSELKAAVLELRRESHDQASVLIAAELAAIADQMTGAGSGPPTAAASALPARPASPSLVAALAQLGPLQIVDVGDDDCEIDTAS